VERSCSAAGGRRHAPPAAMGHDEQRTVIAMISVGERALDFELQDHLGRKIKLGDFRGKRQVLLLFYPLDWTPT
jgi:cytochrome oxidase Cu insertion factor (SCO1/SenC/PrrC family)